jgi:hypothetical protein
MYEKMRLKLAECLVGFKYVITEEEYQQLENHIPLEILNRDYRVVDYNQLVWLDNLRKSPYGVRFYPGRGRLKYETLR